MKMISKIVIPIILALLVVGCNGNNQSNNSNQTTELTTNETVKPITTIDNSVSMEEEQVKSIKILVNNRTLEVALEDNSSAEALYEKLKEGNVTIDAHDFSNFEKVGELGFELPRNDKQYTTKAGDVILYLGTRFVLYYDTNSWDFTKLGEVTNVDGSELKDILGDGNVTMVLSIE